MKGFKRVVSLLMALVMALSLTTGVWAENGGDNSEGGESPKTQSNAGYEFVINKEDDQNAKQTLYFFNQVDDGYMTYNRTISGFRVNEGKIAGIRVFSLDKDGAIFLAFPYDGSLGTIADGADASGIINEHFDEQKGEKAKFAITYMTTNDTNLYVIKLTAKEALGSGEQPDFFDFSFYTGTGESRNEYRFAIEFGDSGNGGNGNNEGNQQGGSALGQVSRDDETLIVESVNNVNDRIELDIDWRSDWGGQIQNIGLTSGVLTDLKSFNKDVFVACYCGVQLTLSKDVIADMANKVTDDNKLWIVTDYRNQDAPNDEGGKAVAFRTQFYIGKNFDNDASGYTLPESLSYQFGIDANGRESGYEAYCPNDTNSALVKENVTVNTADITFESETDLGQRVTFSVGHDGMFVLAPVGYAMQQQWPWYGAGSAAWDPAGGFTPSGAVGQTTTYLQKLYAEGFKAPVLGKDIFVEFPQWLHSYDNPAADGHWDYKLTYDTTSGIFTIEVNNDHAECWKACVEKTTDILSDGVYFNFYIGSGSGKPVQYGADDWLEDFTPETTPEVWYFGNRILTEDYNCNNAKALAVVNKRSTTSTVLTMKQGTVCLGAAISMNDSTKDGKGSDLLIDSENLKYRFAFQFNIVTNTTKAIKLDTEESQKVPKERVSVKIDGSLTNDWKWTAPEDGVVFLQYQGSNDEFRNASTLTDGHLGTLEFTAPAGYTSLTYVADGYSRGNNETKTISVPSGGKVNLPLWNSESGYGRYDLTWTSGTKSLTETLIVELGNKDEYMKLLSNNVKTPETVGTDSKLKDNGVNVSYNKDHGYFSVSVNAGDMNDLSVLQQRVALSPDQFPNAAYFKISGFWGSENPFTHGQDRVNTTKAALAEENAIPISEFYNEEWQRKISIPYVATDTLETNGLTVYFAENQLYRGVIIQWLDENGGILGYSYVYGRNGDFVTAVDTKTAQKVNQKVDAPTLEWSGEGDPSFTCDKNPQSGGNGDKVFFQFGMKDQQGMPEGGWVIYLPYSYFGDLTWETARTRTTAPKIYHYFDESCNPNNCEVLTGEYTPYGVKFQTKSFSPFVVDCSTTTTSGNRYHPTVIATADSPETFDAGIALYGVMAAASLAGMGGVCSVKRMSKKNRKF